MLLVMLLAIDLQGKPPYRRERPRLLPVMPKDERWARLRSRPVNLKGHVRCGLFTQVHPAKRRHTHPRDTMQGTEEMNSERKACEVALRDSD